MSKSQLKTEFVCIATAGATVDGREISAQDLNDMAATYDPELYTAMIWWEHYRFFGNLGQVLSLKVEEIAGKTKLFAELRPTAELLEYNQAGQKVFTSIEIMPNFAKTGKAYLGGLAVTDSPASTGTTQLNFSARGITQTDLIIGNAEPFHFTVSKPDEKEGFINALVEVFHKFTGNNSEPKTQIATAFSDNHNNNEENQLMDKEQFNQLLAAVNGLDAKIDEKFSQQSQEPKPETAPAGNAETVSTEEFKALQTQFNALEEKFNALAKTEVTPIPNGEGSQQKTQFNRAV